jgi:hypothetical protein
LRRFGTNGSVYPHLILLTLSHHYWAIAGI